MAAQLRFAARDSWDEVVSACLRPSPTLAVEDCSAWGRSGRRALHPFDDPGVLLLELVVQLKFFYQILMKLNYYY